VVSSIDGEASQLERLHDDFGVLIRAPKEILTRLCSINKMTITSRRIIRQRRSSISSVS
jgi:hypothetical protein